MPFFAAKDLGDEADNQGLERNALDFDAGRYIGDKILPADSKDYCHFKVSRHRARSPALQQGLSNAGLKSQGLVSIKDLWIKAQGCAT